MPPKLFLDRLKDDFVIKITSKNMANDQRSIPAKGADTAPVRPGTKQNHRDFDKAARMAKSKDKVSVSK